MKNSIIKTLMALAINCIVGLFIAVLFGLPLWLGPAILNLIALIVPLLPLSMLGTLRAGVYQEVWTGKVVEHFTHAEEGTFLDGVPDFSQYAENDVIHMNEVSGDPDVIVNNSTYPLTPIQLPDGDIAISLDKLETSPTSVTDDELYALSYDKIALVKERHANKLAEGRLDRAIHAFAPAKDTPETPVIMTSGESDGTRLKFSRKDVIKMRRKADDMKIPKKGRRLVLCSDHINDLLEEDQKFQNQYHNYETGVIAKMYGFEIYEAINCPVYSQDKVKKAFGSATIVGDFEASVFFYVPRMFKANGSTKMYYSPAATDPLNKRNIVSFTNRFVSMPQQARRSIGAIASATAKTV